MTDKSFPIEVDSPAALADIDSGCWRHLRDAVDNATSTWRLPCLATQSDKGCKQRTVVLRAVDAARRLLLFHTDVRSGKVSAIREHAEVSLLLYDPATKVQVVAQGIASVHTDDMVADRLWNDSASASLKMYLGELPPGTTTPRPNCNESTFVQGRIPERKEIEAGRCNFAAIVVAISELEWLQLSRHGNYRAKFFYTRHDDTISIESQWLTP